MIIIDSKEHDRPLFFITSDTDIMNIIEKLLIKSGVEVIMPDSAILAYRNEKENHYYFGGLDHKEMSDLTDEVLDAIIEEIEHD